MNHDIVPCKDPADPNRCQAMIKSQGQCTNLALEGAGNCAAHGGAKQLAVQRQTSLTNYNLDRWNARIQEAVKSKLGGDGVKGLRDEIAILRMLLESRLNHVKDDFDLAVESQGISDLVLKIERLVTSCHKLEGSMGALIDKTTVINFAAEIITIIGDEVTSEVVLETISNSILSAVGKLGEE